MAEATTQAQTDTNSTTNENNVFSLVEGFDLHLRIDHFEDEGEQIRFIKSVEKMVRRSQEYGLWRSYITDVLGQTTCEITNESITDCSIEVHHHPLGLYTIVETVVRSYLDHKREFSTFDIAKDVIELHFQNKVGYMVLISNMHEKFHNGKLQLPIEFVKGDYKWIPQHYSMEDDAYAKFLELANVHVKDVVETWSKGNYPGLLKDTPSTISVVEQQKPAAIEAPAPVEDIDLDDDVSKMIQVATDGL